RRATREAARPRKQTVAARRGRPAAPDGPAAAADPIVRRCRAPARAPASDGGPRRGGFRPTPRRDGAASARHWPPIQSFAGAAHRLVLGRAMRDALAALARDHDATLAMLCLSAFQALLARYSGQQVIVVGSP